MNEFYPEITPFNDFLLEVGDGHQVYVEQCGNPQGQAVLFIHGGPGGGCSETDRRFFDPEKYHIILFDQRGCGRSKPHGSLEKNETKYLVADIEMIRTKLNVDSWHVFGGSWGSTLALIYAQNHPQRAESLILRGIFMCRKSELHWFYQEGASHIFPDAFDSYRDHIPIQEQDGLIEAYYRRLTSEDVEIRRAAAKEWTRWEMATSRLIPDAEYLEKAEDLDFAVAFARIECHYFINAIFVEEAHILNNVDKIQHIPTYIVQGRYDVVCPTRSAWELHKALPNSKLSIIPDSGHSMGEFGIAKELVNFTDTV